jgi:membrane-associated phospholipid phosphatase
MLNLNAGIIEQLFYYIGNNGPFILSICSLLLLKNKRTFFDFYLFGIIANMFLNPWLKIIIKQPRPSVDQKTFDLAMKHMKNTNYLNLISYDSVLGMPSGHSQSVFFTTAFMYFVFRNQYPNLIAFYLLITIITIVQRVYYKFHTVNQIIVGGLIGILFSYLIYDIASKKQKGSLKMREEENGPL